MTESENENDQNDLDHFDRMASLLSVLFRSPIVVPDVVAIALDAGGLVTAADALLVEYIASQALHWAADSQQ